jgi:hypothetical protein
MSGHNEGAAGVVGEQSQQEGSPWKNVTARHLQKVGTVVHIRLFGINSLKEGTM